MNEASFGTFVKWALNSEVTHVKVCGGEPTLHPMFEAIVKSLKTTGMRIEVITNLTGRDKAISALEGVQLLVNATALEALSDSARLKFEANLEKVAAQNNHVALSFTLYRESQSIDPLIDYCKRYAINKVRLDFSRPSILRRDTISLSTEQVPSFKPKMLELTRQLKAHSIVYCFDCPVLPSLFTEQERSEMNATRLWYVVPGVHLCSMVYINPDLTIASCPHQIVLKNLLTDFEDYPDLLDAVLQAKVMHMHDSHADMTNVYYCEAERFLKDS
jgi:organic radical activating enzyme